MSTSPLGRRRPFIIALSVLACLSIVGLVASDTEGISPSGQIVLIFICYPFFDISHDCMLVPGRALLTDIAEEADGMEETEADLYYTAAQSGGRATATPRTFSRKVRSRVCGCRSSSSSSRRA